MTTTVRDSAINVRSATPEDVPAIERLLTSSSLPTDGVAEAVCDFLIAAAGDDVVGVVGMEYCGSFGLLRSTAVAPGWRGKGIARKLVERIIAEAELRGVHALYLLTTTAEAYFPSFGFSKTTRDAVPSEIRDTGEFRTACPASATVMCLTLPVRSR